MSFTQSEIASIKTTMDAYIKRIRPDQKIRDKIDISYKLYDQSVEIFEIRPNMKGEIMNTPIAKTTFIRTDNSWKVYWMRADMKWHGYITKSVRSISDFVDLVEADEFSCFWG